MTTLTNTSNTSLDYENPAKVVLAPAINKWSRKISVIGLGYVGLPLAVHFSKYDQVIAYDLDKTRVEELRTGQDRNQEFKADILTQSEIRFTNEPDSLQDSDFYIVVVPTPVGATGEPDLTPLLSATDTVGRYLKKGDIVVFESTVYPGVTEELCGPRLEELSGLKASKDFGIAYSPERLNPGDREHTLDQTTKVISAQNAETLSVVRAVYKQIVHSVIHEAPSIKVAEAAKLVENIQRDVNIALMNELAIVFKYLGINTAAVLAAAKTKWNFCPYVPGLVGGHCISVDPYYLIHASQKYGYYPKLISESRSLNNSVVSFIAQETLSLLAARHTEIPCKLGFLGITFKENCPDMRDSRAIDLHRQLTASGLQLVTCDPYADRTVAANKYGITLSKLEDLGGLVGVIVAVAHRDFCALTKQDFLALLPSGGIIVDVKNVVNSEFAGTDIHLWRF